MKKQQLIFNAGDGHKSLSIDGKKYRCKKEVTRGKHLQKIIFEEFDTKEEKKHTDRVNKIITHLLNETGLTVEEVLRNALEYYSDEDLKKLEKKVDRKVKAKVGRGCLEINFGRQEIDIMS